MKNCRKIIFFLLAIYISLLFLSCYFSGPYAFVCGIPFYTKHALGGRNFPLSEAYRFWKVVCQTSFGEMGASCTRGMEDILLSSQELKLVHQVFKQCIQQDSDIKYESSNVGQNIVFREIDFHQYVRLRLILCAEGYEVSYEFIEPKFQYLISKGFHNKETRSLWEKYKGQDISP